MTTTSKKIKDFGDKVGNVGKNLTYGLTVPIILFFVGIFIMPLGIILWIIGLLMFFGMLGSFGKK